MYSFFFPVTLLSTITVVTAVFFGTLLVLALLCKKCRLKERALRIVRLRDGRYQVQNTVKKSNGTVMYWSNGISTSKATLLEAQQDLIKTAEWLTRCNKQRQDDRDSITYDKVITQVDSYKDIAENKHLKTLTENEYRRLKCASMIT